MRLYDNIFQSVAQSSITLWHFLTWLLKLQIRRSPPQTLEIRISGSEIQEGTFFSGVPGSLPAFKQLRDTAYMGLLCLCVHACSVASIMSSSLGPYEL